jgi:hypothetical protein
MQDINQLKRELDGMDILELLDYVKESYPENEELALGSKKLIIRRILNLERNKMNSETEVEE